MNTFQKLVSLVLFSVLMVGCAAPQPGVDNSFGGRAARGVQATLSHELCPYGAKTSAAKTASYIKIDDDTHRRNYYHGGYITGPRVQEGYSGQRSDNCNPPPPKGSK
jgi:hypothetical protein